MYFYMGQNEVQWIELYWCHYLRCLFCNCNANCIYIVFQVVSAVQPKGIKVSKDQDANKENKSEKVFISFNATPKFYEITSVVTVWWAPVKTEVKFEVLCWNIFDSSTVCQISAKCKAGFWLMFCGLPWCWNPALITALRWHFSGSTCLAP